MTPTNLADALGELVGPHGRVEVAYRTALQATRHPAADRWQPVLQQLYAALGMVSGLVAGHTDLPTATTTPAVPAPCSQCGGRTAMRIYDQPWHYTCWLAAGCPLTPIAAAPDITTPAPDQAEPDDAQSKRAPMPPTTPQEPAVATVAATGPERPTQAASGETRTQNGDSASTTELEHFSRAVRAVPGRDGRPRWPDATEAQCQAALTAWHTHVVYKDQAARFGSAPSATGLLIFEWLLAQNGSMVSPAALQNKDVVALTKDGAVLRTMSFLDVDQAPVVGQGVTEVDVNAQYLAAARSTELGDGEPELLGPVAPDALSSLLRSPGWVQLGDVPNLSGLPVTARGPFARLQPGSWLPAPMASYLNRDHHVPLDVTAAWTWPGPRTESGKKTPARHGRRLEVWCGMLAGARASLTTARAGGDIAAAMALGVLKAVYAATLGGMFRSEQHNKSGSYRPDWTDMYIAQADANALRAIDKVLTATASADRAPRLLGMMRDSAWWVADTAPHDPAGLVISEQPGKWHRNRWGLVSDALVSAHQAGRVGLVRRAITQADTDRLAAIEPTATDTPPGAAQ